MLVYGTDGLNPMNGSGPMHPHRENCETEGTEPCWDRGALERV